MAYDEITALLGGWEGFELVGVRREPMSETDPVPQIVLELRPLPGHPKRCSRCGEQPGSPMDGRRSDSRHHRSHSFSTTSTPQPGSR